MQPIQYNSSFITGKWSENSVRFWVESRTRFIDEQSGRSEDYYQCGSCKSEDTFAENNLFYEDNYDFTPVFGPEYGIVFRRHAYLTGTYKLCPEAVNMWGGQTYRLKEPAVCRLLNTNEEIRNATNEGWMLVAQTEISNPDLGLKAIIEYPVKTMNIHNEKNLYQVDTGPVCLPDLTRNYDRAADSIRLAYVAFNAPHFADFVVEQPTPIVADGNEICKVNHYSGPISLTASNRLFAIE
ncbi:hypothetical protein [Paenibacillus eucommiae]|uniref:Uncharacterized protein n=1 Tax=Paenibacillus eucommiae TaxID=1355755 RepID=A0ABS4ILN2_9BACL|nr:hypothetical protein [Paenibacillus eucommiae]MBP1988477.1 hypothetical protein [Paenibacillus eucommiae]